MKLCGRCSTEKPLPEFPRSSRNKDGRGSRCNACALEVTAAWRAAHPDLKGHRRKLRLLAKYGITEEEYAELLDAQAGGCALCGAPPGKVPLAVDHDHRTGRVRGLLCLGCNTALGHLGDTATAIRRVLEYLA